MDYNLLSMSKMIRQIFIATKQGLQSAADLSLEMAGWLEERGMKAIGYENSQREERIALPPGTDLVLVLGGDGTLIAVARRTLDQGVPLLGVNMGRVGFLAEAEFGNWKECLEGLIQKGVQSAERLALKFAVVRDGRTVHEAVAVNDLVINRGSLARLIKLGLFLGGERLGSLRSDGVIVATPNGSTAYSISAGGPVLHPELMVYSVTPICPFLNNFRPIVLPGDSSVEIEIAEDKAEVFLTQDGQLGYRLQARDRLAITRHCPGPLFVKAPEDGYLRKLHAKEVLE